MGHRGAESPHGLKSRRLARKSWSGDNGSWCGFFGFARTITAVAIFTSAEGIKPLLKNSAAIGWIRDAFAHLKVIGYSATAKPLFEKAGIADDLDESVIELDAQASIGRYIEAAKQQRVWDREARLSGDDT